jgi:UDP:flavonoid glycosyltransferase YjiC (YdhE family)
MRILFVAEAVTLAQVVRLAALARGLDPARHEVHFASAAFDELVFRDLAVRRWPIRSLSPETVARAVARGARIYGGRTLARYLEDDQRVLAEVRPDLVVGDLRWSLAVAAPKAGIPYAALINAYWSPYAVRDGFPLPDHPIVKLLGLEMAERHFPRAMPAVFSHFARPLNRLRRRHGLAPIGSLPDVLAYGDYTLYPDVPELVPTSGAPSSHVYLGPVSWSPDLPLPPWWSKLDPKRPTAYVTLGSSGRAQALSAVLDGLAAEKIQILLSTAGRPVPATLPAHTHVAPYLPGEIAARRADFVVSNGGSTTGYQALAEGRPVLGVPFNLDQYLAMTAIARAGAGILVRGGSARAEAISAAARRLLEDPAFSQSAATLARTFAAAPAARRFDDFLATATRSRPATSPPAVVAV